MAAKQGYEFVFPDCLRYAGISVGDLSDGLALLILKAEKALDSLNQADENTQGTLMFIIAGADALICDGICQAFAQLTANWQPPSGNEHADIEKVKLLALKAKALRLKWSSENA